MIWLMANGGGRSLVAGDGEILTPPSLWIFLADKDDNFLSQICLQSVYSIRPAKMYTNEITRLCCLSWNAWYWFHLAKSVMEKYSRFSILNSLDTHINILVCCLKTLLCIFQLIMCSVDLDPVYLVFIFIFYYGPEYPFYQLL